MPRKRSAKPMDADFRGDSNPQLMKGSLTNEEAQEIADDQTGQLKPRRNGAPMPIINFSEYDLENIPELKVLPAGSEVKLRVLDVSIAPDKNGDLMLKVRLDVSDEPEVKDVYWTCHFPKSAFGEKRAAMLKDFLSQFCEAFDISKTADNDTSDWLGKEGWAILGVRTDAKYGDSNEVNRWLRQQ